MVVNFEVVETIFVDSRGQFILARVLDGILDFDLSGGATFGGTPIYPAMEMPRIPGNDNKPHPDVFVFRPNSHYKKTFLLRVNG